MDVRILSFAAAALAFGAAVVMFARADPGEDPTLRVVALAAVGIFLIAYGRRQPRADSLD
ncbi:MAG: hypothetical protein ABIW16_04050 [Sphingomicrobium sp.]